MDNYPLSDAATLARVMVSSGDTVEAIADKRYASIAVRIEGEHDSEQEVVLRYGARLGEMLNGLKLTRDADINAIQLYRDSVKVRQKEMLGSSLKAFEASILTARSASDGEASLRKSEADLLMQWVARAKRSNQAVRWCWPTPLIWKRYVLSPATSSAFRADQSGDGARGCDVPERYPGGSETHRGGLYQSGRWFYPEGEQLTHSVAASRRHL